MQFEARVTRQVSEEELAREDVEGFRPIRSWRSALVAVAFAALGVTLLLVSRYTFSLGLSILLMIALGLAMPVLRRRDRRVRKSYAHLIGEQEHGVDAEGIWLRTPQLEVRSTWANLRSFRRHEGVLHFSCVGMQTVSLPEAALVEAGCFDAVMALAGPRERR